MKHVTVLARYLTMLAFLLLFTGYGNKKVHPDLNRFMLEQFVKQAAGKDFAGSKFEQYLFYLNDWGKIRGTAITKNGLFPPGDVSGGDVVGDLGIGFEKVGVSIYSDEGPAEMTPREWIIDGGFAADVPEIPASLRHFYDPTKPAADRYLTDIANSKIMGNLQRYALTNPRTNGLDWALGTPGQKAGGVQDHQYTWERGKEKMRFALQEPDPAKRNALMAFAWRSLGETLHMIADHGCPPHVRDDAHPSPLWGNNNLFGNPDPYEELMDILRTKDPGSFTALAAGTPDPGLKSRLPGLQTAREVAHELAVFTNAGFFTNETIAGTDRYGNYRTPLIHPQHTYAAPRLDQLSYNEDDHAYYDAQGIRQCTDRSYFAGLIPRYVAPFVDFETVRSQASRLLPTLVNAGAHLIRLYIPALQLQWQMEEKGQVKGSILHQTDAEYPDPILYQGPVIIAVRNDKGKLLREETIEAADGEFETRLKLEKGERARARIEFGGVWVQSADELSGGGEPATGVTGLYEGSFTIDMNQEALQQALYRQSVERINREESNPQARENMIRNSEGWSRDMAQAIVTNLMGVYNTPPAGSRARFEVQSPGGMESYYKTEGLLYTVMSLGHESFLPGALTPLQSGLNAGTTLQTRPDGFTATGVMRDDYTFQVEGKFSPQALTGTWTASLQGTVIWTASFQCRKIRELN